MRPAGAFFAAILILAAVEFPATAAPIEQTVEEHDNQIGEVEKRANDFVHRSSGYVYPLILDEMPARKTHSFDTGNASVYYTLRGGALGDPWITLYVYPATNTVAAESHNVDDAIVEHMGGQTTAAPVGLPAGPPGSVDKWYRGSINGVSLLTGYRLVRAGNWFVKARISIPAAGGDAAIARAMRSIGAIPWAVPVATSPAVTATL